MKMKLDSAYTHCEQITNTEARNFSYAFRTLPVPKRRAIHAAYAFCRLCDDIADGDYTIEEKTKRFIQIRENIRNGLTGKNADPVFIALKDTSESFGIPNSYFEEIIDGVEMDLSITRYQSFADLKEYCYKVASVVGLVSIKIFGYQNKIAETHAIDLGIAMQLTNIIRDVKEDLVQGRIYLPIDELKQFGYTNHELESSVVNDAFRELMRFQISRAREYFINGKELFKFLTPQSRICPSILHAVYSAILDQVANEDYNVFQHRIGLSTRRKWLIMVRLWASSLIPAIYRPKK